MLASDFFKYSIDDNNYSGIMVSQDIVLEEDFNCDLSGCWYEKRPEYRQKAICEFLQQLYNKLGIKNLNELKIHQIAFDNEYEANLEQQVFNLTGSEYSELTIYTTNIAGSLNFKNCQFNINCRFGNTFLQYMIASSSGFIELEKLGSIINEIGIGEWLLIYYWKLQLKRAFGLGLYKTYREQQNNLPTIRGKINIKELLKKEYIDGNTNCIYNEHSYINEINRVIFLALDKVFKSKYNKIVTDISSIYRSYLSLNFDKNRRFLKDEKIKNPYFHKYNEVYKLSAKILNNQFASISTDNSKISAFLFDISLLFEHHIRKVLKRKYSLFNKNVSEYKIPNGICDNNLFPDIIIELDKQKKEICIYDVKYKHFNHNKGVAREDRFQLTTYVSCYLNDYEIVECGFIYPVKQSEYGIQLNKINDNQTLIIGNRSIRFRIYLYPVAEDVNNQEDLDKRFVNTFQQNIEKVPLLTRI